MLDPSLLLKGRAISGHKLAITGPFHCQVPKRNPGKLADGWVFWQPPRITLSGKKLRVMASPDPPAWGVQIQRAFENWLSRLFAAYPDWYALERAVWLGDPSQLPPSLLTFYREGGLLHLLSVNSQRAQLLALLVGYGGRLALILTSYLGGLGKVRLDLSPHQQAPPSAVLPTAIGYKPIGRSHEKDGRNGAGSRNSALALP